MDPTAIRPISNRTPLLDRVDIQLFVPRLTRGELMSAQGGEPSASVRERVEAARARQRQRLAHTAWSCNAAMPGAMARGRAGLSDGALELLSKAVERLALSGRGFDRAIRVARTIADLAGSEPLELGHMSEALGYRALAASATEERSAAIGR